MENLVSADQAKINATEALATYEVRREEQRWNEICIRINERINDGLFSTQIHNYTEGHKQKLIDLNYNVKVVNLPHSNPALNVSWD